MTYSYWLILHLVAGVPGYRQRNLTLLAGNNVFSGTKKAEL